MSKVHANYDEMVAGVAQETGMSEDDVRKVLSASFPSTRAYILAELQKGAEVEGQGWDREDHVPA